MLNLRNMLLLMIACALLALAPMAHGQLTSGSISGTVLAADGSAIPGVTVEAVHVPTGIRYSTVTGINGRFVIPNARVGGPYRVTASLEGFRTQATTGTQVPLGGTAEVPMTLQLAAVAEAITVTAVADDVINPNRTGSVSTVTTEEIEVLPTVNRNLYDFARTNPYFNSSLSSDSGDFLSVAGTNNRYNDIKIDGAVNNDLFGLAASGTPGGQTGTQPISLEAIQELQLVVSPYDVRQSGFTGGGINAVTRSGTNALEGSVFGTKRDAAYVGEGPFEREVTEFDQEQYGGRIGGPIVGDRLFFFLSGESNERLDPHGTSADGSTGTVYSGTPSAAAVQDFVLNQYGVDLGGLGDIIFGTNSQTFFGRIDVNASDSHNLVLRHNYVNADRDNNPSSASRSSSRFYFPTFIYPFLSETNSTVGQWNAVFGGNRFNEARVNFTTVRENREVLANFPTVEIGGGERSGTIAFGTERFSGANALDQDILEITDDFTMMFGEHTVVLGTSNQMFEFSNLFIPEANGYYHFRTFEDFQAGTADIYKITFATGNDPRRPTQFEAAQYSLYANDTWRTSQNLTLTFGLRLNKPQWGTTPSFNPQVQEAIGFSTAETPSDSIVFEPRLGFNWNPGTATSQQVRGGIGVFQGRPMMVWISNNFGNTGIETLSLGCLLPSCTPPPFNPDPTSQPRDLAPAGGRYLVNVIDPDFQFPRVLRATLGYDRELPLGFRGTAEVLWSQTQKDIFYYNVNLEQTGTSPLDGRPTYRRRDNPLLDAILLSNTDEGEQLIESVQLSRRFRNLNLFASYAHQDVKTVSEGRSSIAYSNWQFNQLSKGDVFAPELSTSSFEIAHRFNMSAAYDVATGPFAHRFGLFYAANSGQPYSLLIDGDPNRDGSFNNDLLYVPAAGELILCPAGSGSPTATNPCGNRTALDSAAFTNFLESVGLDPTSGTTPDRNVLQQPWQRRLDFHYEIGLPIIYGTRVAVQADILNLLNLFDNEAGVQRFVNFDTYRPVRYQGQDPTTGKAVYREAFNGALTPGRQFSTANIASRWQARLGLRISF
ncbi:MAG TPA: carboxypeptidase regulatory-like domain-containing protein [Thermoanaerobaculia bacterium]|nr:carboxypeptidase regulatory-like domain-containing protein [Thermoanaerobaculia bacterium]